MLRRRQHSRQRSARRRRGVECVEVAITLPIFILLAGVTLQIVHRIHVSKMLHLATYEAVRAGGEPSGNAAIARRVFEDRTKAFGIEGAKLFLSASFDRAKPRARIAARSTAPTAANSLPFPTYLILPSKITGAKVIYRKEN